MPNKTRTFYGRRGSKSFATLLWALERQTKGKKFTVRAHSEKAINYLISKGVKRENIEVI